jgi:hypothetical protein
MTILHGRWVLGVCAAFVAGCAGDAPPGGNNAPPDAARDSGGGGGVDAPAGFCSLPATTPATGTLTATKAQRCTVPGSMGQKHWYRLAGVLPSGPADYVQLDLWDQTGGFGAGPVTTGTYTIMGPDAAYGTCGVCGRAMGDKGANTQKEYFATSGTVNVTAVGTGGAPFTATLTNLGLVEVDPTTRTPVTGGCTANIASTTVSGTEMDVVMMMCPPGVGD